LRCCVAGVDQEKKLAVGIGGCGGELNLHNGICVGWKSMKRNGYRAHALECVEFCATNPRTQDYMPFAVQNEYQ
jgi:hypothetical protein